MKKCKICGSIIHDNESRCLACGAIICEKSSDEYLDDFENASNAEKVLRSVVRITTDNSVGTGFIYDGSLVITNAHVVSLVDDDGNLLIARTIRASFSERVDSSNKKYLLELLSIDVQEDVAVLKFCDDVEFPSLDLFDDRPKMGEKVFTIGCPLGFDFSYCSGHISDPEREVSGKVNKVIQTDMNTNHGNSGGPLCNVNGEVIGMISFNECHESGDDFINTPDGPQKILITRPISGMSFSVTSDAIRQCLEAMKMYQ